MHNNKTIKQKMKPKINDKITGKENLHNNFSIIESTFHQTTT